MVATALVLSLAGASPAEAAELQTTPSRVEGPTLPPNVDASSHISCRASKSCVRAATLSGVTGGLGLSATIVGATFLATPDRVDPEIPLQARSLRRPGIVTLSLGISVLAMSVVMAIAAGRAAKQRRSSLVSRLGLRLRP